ncbi:MAG: hypothetical protein K2X27_17555 [Candidatus Obscuribacterales bacterium]|nr:hypothetical protein [Candidatus Obscuribacterales bacterium]
MRPAVIFDMDGTLADCSHRLHWIKDAKKKNWQKFFEGTAQDQPRLPLLKLAQQLSAENVILIASGRPEHLRLITENWLRKHGLSVGRIYLRADADRRSDGLVKAEMLVQMHKDGFEPWLVVDDRDSAVAAWRELGLICLQCDEGHY